MRLLIVRLTNLIIYNINIDSLPVFKITIILFQNTILNY